ncbi:hypothetical protein H9P43_008705 [Blastocladiella emersonii ATCC 22665]|nr:hypothetical protein H9P43_008705 [Blastocladiella emersonii ATCC 22665]
MPASRGSSPFPVSLPALPGSGTYSLTHADTLPLRLGYLGTAAASAAAERIILAHTALCIWRVDGHQCWAPWSRAALHGWTAYVKLGLPGMVTLGPLAFVLTAQAVVVNFVTLVIMVPVGICAVTVARVGNQERGGREPRQISRAFTSDPNVFEQVAGIHNVTLYGCGKHRVAAGFSLAAYYVVGIPLGVVLTFVAKLGLPAMWYGLAGGLAMCLVGQTAGGTGGSATRR